MSIFLSDETSNLAINISPYSRLDISRVYFRGIVCCRAMTTFSFIDFVYRILYECCLLQMLSDFIHRKIIALFAYNAQPSRGLNLVSTEFV